MKKAKRISFIILAMLMAVTFNITAYATDEMQLEDTQAAEVQSTEPMALEFEITADMADEGYIAVPLSVDQTFTMTTSHRGADRTYSGTTLAYVISITDANGNAVDNTVAVELYDYNSSTALHGNVIEANGGLNYYSIPIVANRVYYFRYTKISGTTRTLSVHMSINSY